MFGEPLLTVEAPECTPKARSTQRGATISGSEHGVAAGSTLCHVIAMPDGISWPNCLSNCAQARVTLWRPVPKAGSQRHRSQVQNVGTRAYSYAAWRRFSRSTLTR